MAMDHSEARAMLAASLRHPALTAQIVPAPHTLAFDRTIIEMIAGGYIGELISIDARIAAARSYPDGSAQQHWRQNRAFSGDNIMSYGYLVRSDDALGRPRQVGHGRRPERCPAPA